MTVNVTVAMDCFRLLLLPKSIFIFARSCNKILPVGEAACRSLP